MYSADITEIYELEHTGNGKDYRAEADEIARRVAKLHPDATSLLDVACGTGAHLSHFRDLFAHVEGVELAPAMVRRARARMPGVPVHEADMRSFSLGRGFDVVTCMFGSIGYVRDRDELAATVRTLARHLQAGGVLAIDPWWFPETFLDGHVAGRVTTAGATTVARLSHSVRDGDASRMRVDYLVADAVGGVRHHTETHLISLFSRQTYESCLAAAGLSSEYVPGLHGGRGLFLASRP